MRKINLEEYDNNNQYLFSHGPLTVFFVKYINYIALIAWLALLVIDTFHIDVGSDLKLRFPVTSIQYVLPIWIFLGLLHYFYYFKQAYKIIFDNEDVTIFYYRGNKKRKYKIEDVTNIKLGIFLNFKFKDGCSVWFNDYRTNEYFKFVKKMNLPFEWGLWGKSRLNL